MKELEKKLASLPSGPGVYLMKDAGGHVLYVGKALDLKKRVTSYFSKAPHKDLKTSVLIKKIADLDTILTRTEKEALILESNLIKRHRPRYNAVLKDDKRYPSLRLDIKSPYPNLTIARKFQKDGALYFGPFASARAVRETRKFIHRTFKIRKCKGTLPMRRERPCLNYQMGLCLGACSRPIDPAQYALAVDEVIMFLKGRMPQLIQRVKKQMGEAAAQQDFEAAAAHRDRLSALERTLEKQVATTTDFKDRDVVGLARRAEAALIMVLFIRNGFLLGNRPFYFPETVAPDDEVVSSFVKQYYENAPFIPKEVLLPSLPEDRDVLEEWLRELKGEKVYIMVPQRGEKARIAELAQQNAKKTLEEYISTELAEQKILERLQKRLALRSRPERIECFDLSNLAGAQSVGAMVVFQGARPCPKAYRKYRVKASAGADDYAMLREVMGRRYRQTGPEQPLPDLVIVDGGKGQLSVATGVLKSLNLHESFDLVSIAKKDPAIEHSQDKVYKPGRKNPLNLKRDLETLLFIQRIRDEAHRYVITYHRKRRLMTYRRSVLEGISGIGTKRRAGLIRHFGSLKRIKAAAFSELCAVPGMTRQAAQNLVEALEKPRSAS